MYPGFARTAREEGFHDIADWFEVCNLFCRFGYAWKTNLTTFFKKTLAKAEKSHAGKFNRVLEEVTANATK